MSRMIPLVSVVLYKFHKRYSNIVYLSFDPLLSDNNSEDNNGDFRKRCKRVILGNMADFL